MTGLTRALLFLLSGLPRRLLQWLGALVGRLHGYAATRAARVTEANLRLCFPTLSEPELRQLVRASLVATGKTLLETPAVWLNRTETMQGWIASVDNEPLLEQAIAAPSGCLILLPHTGNWELFNVYFRRHGSMAALYQPPEQASLQGLLAELRSRHGNVMLPADRSGVTRLYRTLHQGGVAVVLPDQTPASGRFAPFFGQPALTDELAVRLARKTGATVIGAAVLRLPDGRFKLVFIEPHTEVYSPDTDQALAAVNTLIEDLAKLALPQYQWEYKRFRKRQPGAAKLYQFHQPPGVH